MENTEKKIKQVYKKVFPGYTEYVIMYTRNRSLNKCFQKGVAKLMMNKIKDDVRKPIGSRVVVKPTEMKTKSSLLSLVK